MKNIAFIGLGVMGYPMAGHLQKAGFNVTVYNRTTAKADNWVQQYGGSFAKTPLLAAKEADVICICVGNDDDLRQVVIGEDGICANVKPDAIVIDHTTTSAIVAREMEIAIKEKGAHFLDAPVSGGQAGAENGKLTVMLGGEEDIYQRCDAVLNAYSAYHRLLGPIGSGQLAKMMNQICIAGVVQGLAEALNFGQKAGLDCEAVVDVISKGAAGSWQMENRHKTMLADEYEFGFAIDWMRKDLNIALEEARQNGSSLPLAAMVDQYYADVQNMGGGRWDTSSLMARFTKK